MDWSEAEPVLKATYDLLDDAELIGQEQVFQKLGREPGDEQTIRVLARLYEGGYINGMTVDRNPAPVRIRATLKGLEQVRGWPREGGDTDQLVELLLRLLDERIAAEDTPEQEKGKLKRVRDGIASLGRDFAVDLMAAYVARVSGID
jgi:hypothetical protein